MTRTPRSHSYHSRHHHRRHGRRSRRRCRRHGRRSRHRHCHRRHGRHSRHRHCHRLHGRRSRHRHCHRLHGRRSRRHCRRRGRRSRRRHRSRRHQRARGHFPQHQPAWAHRSGCTQTGGRSCRGWQGGQSRRQRERGEPGGQGGRSSRRSGSGRGGSGGSLRACRAARSHLVLPHEAHGQSPGLPPPPAHCTAHDPTALSHDTAHRGCQQPTRAGDRARARQEPITGQTALSSRQQQTHLRRRHRRRRRHRLPAWGCCSACTHCGTRSCSAAAGGKTQGGRQSVNRHTLPLSSQQEQHWSGAGMAGRRGAGCRLGVGRCPHSLFPKLQPAALQPVRAVPQRHRLSLSAQCQQTNPGALCRQQPTPLTCSSHTPGSPSRRGGCHHRRRRRHPHRRVAEPPAAGAQGERMTAGTPGGWEALTARPAALLPAALATGEARGGQGEAAH